MNLDANWRIRSDAYQFVLERKVTVAKRDKDTRQPTGETVEEWEIHGYYPAVEQMTRAIVTKEARVSVAGVETLREFLDAFGAAISTVRVAVAEAVSA